MPCAAGEGPDRVPPHPLLSVVIPSDSEGRRDSLLERVRSHVARVLPEAEVVVARGPVDPYCKARVCNEGARSTTGDVILFVDGDMIHHPEMLKRAAAVEIWGATSCKVRNLSPGEFPGGKHKVRTGRVLGRGGLFAFTREVWEKVGGFDEGYIGWGMEDQAIYKEVSRVLGPPEDLGSEPAWHLYHEPQPDRKLVRANPNHPNRKRLRWKGEPVTLRIVNTSRNVIVRAGYVFRPGETVEIKDPGEYRRREIRACSKLRIEPVEPEPEKAPENVETSSFMSPPRHICACGYVGKDEQRLEEHREGCGKNRVAKIRLNLGCGTDIRADFVNIDIRELPGVDVVADVRDLSAYFGRGQVDYILALDIVEHFPQSETREILGHWASLLRPGGTLEIQCPDVAHASRIAYSDDWLIQLIYGAENYPENFHKAGFTLATMMELLDSLGFSMPEKEQTKAGNLHVKARK